MPASPQEVFTILWTVGFAGKRAIPPEREPVVRAGLSRTLEFLSAKAARHAASLTAVSSIARGGDVIFAELALGGDNRTRWHWKCVLPFAAKEFLDQDLAGLDAGARDMLRRRAERCLQLSAVDPIVTSPDADHRDGLHRERAYLDCGYRVVDEADVVIVLLTGAEIAAFEKSLTQVSPALAGPGSAAVARYACAAHRPLILLDADADDPWEARKLYNDPEAGGSPHRGFFYDDQVTSLVLDCVAEHPQLPGEGSEFDGQTLYTPMMRAVAHLQYALGASADLHQTSTVRQLRLILTLHLLATGIAALLATQVLKQVLVGTGLETVFVLWFLAAMTLLKPGMAWVARLVEQRLHHQKTRERWTQARVLAELCRGGLALWPLPQQPLDAQDEEDFPRIKRILRTLRLLREQDRRAAVTATPVDNETQEAADMRAACDVYAGSRLDHQIAYYAAKRDRALVQGRRWRRTFVWATLSVIVIGLLLLLGKVHEVSAEAAIVYDALPPVAPLLAALAPLEPAWDAVGHVLDATEPIFEAAIIIAPFLAAYALATMSLLDCTRRERRYAEMIQFLGRMRDTLRRTESNASRLRLIEHAERSLIEEQHEWFSVMRNLNV